MSEHLSPGQVNELRSEPERQLTRLQKSMKVTDEALRTVELDQTAVGRLSRMDSLQNQSLSKGLRDREVVRLSQIRQVLARLKKSSECARCARVRFSSSDSSSFPRRQSAPISLPLGRQQAWHAVLS